MRETGIIACLALLLAITGTRAGPLLEARNGTDAGAVATSNESQARADICRNATCVPGFDTIVGVIQNITANASKTPGFDSIVGVIQNSTANASKTPGFDSIVGVIQNSTANASKTPGFDSIVGVIQNSTANASKTPGFDSIVGVIQNSTANASKTPGFDSIVGVIQNSTANATKGHTAADWSCGGNASLAANQSRGATVPKCASAPPPNCQNNTHFLNATAATERNTTLRNDTTGELMFNDEDVPKINETVDGDRSACPALVGVEAWGGRPPLAVQRVRAPAAFVVIHHTYIPAACNHSADCEAKMRHMQDFHMAKGWLNIGYNFIVGGDGRVYVGRGWDVVGAHSPVYNSKSVGISFIGDYRTELPTQEMLELSWWVIRCGVARGSISEAYTLVGHRQVRDTECPGDRLYQEIQGWPHWAAYRDIIPRNTTTTNKPPA